MTSFKDWTYKDASEAITAAIKAGLGENGFKSNLRFVEDHDHWQDGDNWVGPDGGLNSPLRTQILAGVQKQFTPVDVIGEVLDNVANALLSHEADVSFAARVPAKPDTEEAKTQKARAEEMRSLISQWWDQQKLWEKSRKAVKRSRWSGRGALRTWIAPSTLTPPAAEGAPRTLPTDLTFEDALSKVLLSAPKPDACFVVTDPETNEKAAVRLFAREEKKYAEIWFVDNDKTVVRELLENGTSTNSEFPVELGGRLPIAEMEADVLITEPVRRQQNRVNFFESLLVRVGETAGFPERYTTNAKPQGMWMTTPPSNAPALETYIDDKNKTWYLHATPRTLGAAITSDLRGIETVDEGTGRKTTSTPGVIFKDPTDPEYAIKAATHARLTILRDCKQGHLSGESTAEASGIAYVQARAGFESDLTNTKSPLEGMLRDIIEVTIAWAELMSKGKRDTEAAKKTGVATPSQSFLADFRCVVNLHVNAGPITPDEKKSNAEMVDKGLLSRETGMAANGVEDVAAEIERIDNSPKAKKAAALDTFTTIKTGIDAGTTAQTAAEMAGMSPDEAKKFASSPFTQPPVVQ